MMAAHAYTLTDKSQLPEYMSELGQALKEHGSLSVCWNSKDAKRGGQLALFHVWVRDIARALNRTGHEVADETVKTLLKREHGIVEMVAWEGKEVPTLKSLGDYTKDEMMDLLSKIDVWAAERGICLSADPHYAVYREAIT